MSEPPTRQIWFALLLGFAGMLLFVFLAEHVSPGASIDFRLSSQQVRDSASAFMDGLGYHVDTLTEDSWFITDPSAEIYLQQQYSMERANAIIRSDSLPAHFWVVSWYDRRLSVSQNPEHFTLLMSPEGRILRYDHEILDTVSLPTLDADSARVLAEQVLSRFHPDLAAYSLKSSSAITLPHRVDHRFTYGRTLFGVNLTLQARVQGDEVGEIRWDTEYDRSFTAEFSSNVTMATLMVTVSMVANFLLFFFVVILFLRKYHEGEVGTRTALLVFAGYVVVSMISILNQYRGVGATTMIGDLNKAYVRLISVLMWIFVLQMFLGVLVFSAWSVGESSSRGVWFKKMTSMDALLSFKYFSRNAGESIALGYGWGFTILGLHALLLSFLIRHGTLLYLRDLEGLPEAFLPGIQPLLVGGASALLSEIVYRLFFLSYFTERTRRRWAGVLFSVVLWCVAAEWTWMTPFGTLAPGWHTLAMAAYGAVFVLLFLKYDLLTAMVAHFVIVASGMAIPMLYSSGSALAPDRVIFWACLCTPFAVGLIGLVRGKEFEFTPELMPKHIQRISERVRMAKELEIARNVQMSLLPKTHPMIEGCDIAGMCIPALEVGGDYFDFVRLGPQKLGIALGDVSGKGVPAAIYMTLTKGILQSNAEENVTPKVVLSKVNSLMYRTIERNSFVSMLYAVLDAGEGTLRFARAGQCPILLTAIAGGEEQFLTTRGMALGLEAGETFTSVLEERELRLRAGEVLVFYTDGFTEAMNARGEEFGEERLVASVRRHRDHHAREVIESIIEDVRVFTGNVPQHDDMTIVVVKVVGRS
jgi:sigma-B regulation protein RsbU (phosphoserine phosphatase)